VDDARPSGRLRQVAMIVVFDLGGPLLAYALLRSAGLSAVAALVVSGVLPALGIAVGAWAGRRLDIIGVVVLAGILIGTILQAHSLRVRARPVRLDAGLRRAREEKGRTPGRPRRLTRATATWLLTRPPVPRRQYRTASTRPPVPRR
jgi:hypothetical protein